MSHRSGKVFALDGSLIGWFEYNGSVDVARTQIFATQDNSPITGECHNRTRARVMASPLCSISTTIRSGRTTAGTHEHVALTVASSQTACRQRSYEPEPP